MIDPMIDHIQARRDELATHIAQARQQYAELEESLRLLDRQLCAMAGGIQELDALLKEAESCASPPAS